MSQQFVDPYQESAAPMMTANATATQNNQAPAQKAQFVDPYQEQGQLQTAQPADNEQQAHPEVFSQAFVQELAQSGIGLNQILMAGLNKIGVVDDATYKAVSKDFHTVAHAQDENLAKDPANARAGSVAGVVASVAPITKLPSLAKGGSELVAKYLPEVAANLVKRFGSKAAVQGAEAGAIGGATTYVPEDGSRLVNTGAGALLGAGTGKILEKTILRPTIVNAPKPAPGAAQVDEAATASAATAKPADEAAAAGAGKSADETAQPAAGQPTGANVTDGFRAKVEAPPEQTRFVNEADQQGIRVSKGDATQDFAQQQFEGEAAKLSDVGGDMRAFRAGQQEDIVNRARNLNTGVGGTQDKVAAGAEIQQTLRKGDKAGRAQVSESYEVAKAAKGIEAPVPTNFAKDEIKQIYGDFEDVIPGPITKKLESYGIIAKAPLKEGEAVNNEEIKQFTVGEAEKLIKSINARIGATSDRATAEGLRQIKSSLDNALDSMAQGSDEAVNLFKEARALRREHGDVYEQNDIVQNIIDKKAKYTNYVNPQSVVDKIVKDRASNLENIPKIRNALIKSGPEGTKAWNSLRAATVNDLFEGSIIKAEGDIPKFNTSHFNKQMERIGDDALKLILTPKEFSEIKKFQRVVTQIQNKVPGAINNSNTATALLNMVNNKGLFNGFFGGLLRHYGRKITKVGDVGKINEAITGARRPAQSAVEAAKEQTVKMNSPLLRLIGATTAREITSPNNKQ
jgi:hypothetical protein